jgi:hypothetical protein
MREHLSTGVVETDEGARAERDTTEATAERSCLDRQDGLVLISGGLVGEGCLLALRGRV